MMLRRIDNDERGMALITVILVMFVLLAITTAYLSYSSGAEPLARRDQDWNAALSAAEGGIDDYIFRLNQNPAYWRYSSTNLPPDGNTAFTGWSTLTGSTVSQFRYTPDTSSVTANGTLKLTASGKVGSAIRTLVATIRQRTFLDYLYFTDYETKDPASYNTGSPDFDQLTPTQAQTLCALHYYEGRDSQCTDIAFGSRDVINGPLHSNDAILISGTPTFNGPVTTAWNDPAGLRYRGTGTPTFANAGDPKLVAPLSVPQSDSSIKSAADAALGGTGCLFTGPTTISFNSNGTMNVNSPFTKSSNCPRGTNVAMPANGVIYVQNVPTVTTDPNYTSGCPYTNNSPVGYPITGDITTYGCRNGDAFVQGTVKGQVTVATENNIMIVGNTQYASGTTGSDLLGLVANNYVEIYHPASCDQNGNCTNLNVSGGQPFNNPVIYAAILSVQHSFFVQNYKLGTALGNLNVTGSIAQRYRGIVGTFGTQGATSGYNKAYVYDQRLKYEEPPHFLVPVASAWQSVGWSEVAPAYTG
jgi:type II secretory pathway pseudopilin PulG